MLSIEDFKANKASLGLCVPSKGSALNKFLDSFAFLLFPVVFDLGVAVAYFLIRPDPFYSLVIIAVMWCYIYITIYMAMWRAKARRDIANNNREMEAVR
jgi:ABC-type transport system involved in Fe-S cluster assembly fused permease/ATPase subunit